jgi:autonomous glycyl radical cofactor GrcA
VLISHHRIDQPAILESANVSRTLSVAGASVSVTTPPTVNVDAGRLSVARSAAAAFARSVSGIADRTLSLQGADVSVSEPPSIAVEGGQLSVSRSATASVQTENERSTTVSRTISLSGATVTVQAPPTVTVEGGRISVGRSVTASAIAEVEKSASVSRTIGLQGADVAVTAPPAVNVEGGQVSVSRTAETGYQVETGYEETFFSTDLTTSATQCAGGVCESTSQNDDATDSGASQAAGATLEVTFQTGAMTSNGDASVTIEALDGNGSSLASKTENVSTGLNTYSFTFSAPSGTEQIRIDRSVIANSQLVSGFTCSTDGDCTNESATIESDITVIEQ